MSKHLKSLCPVDPRILNLWLMIGLCVFFTSSTFPAFGQDQAKAPVSFQINHSVLSYYDNSNQYDASSDRFQKTVTTSRYTELVINAEGYHLHLFPVCEGSPFQLGYDLMDGVEFGLTLSQNTEIQKDINYSWKSNLAGLYAVYALPLASNLVEFVLGLDSISGSTSGRNDQGEIVMTKYRGLDQYVGINLIHNLTGSLSFVGSATFIATQQKDSITHKKTRSTYVGFTPFAIRLDL